MDSRLLTTALRSNAAYSGGSGLALAVGAPALDGPFGVHAGILATVGVSLIGYAAAIIVALRSERLVRPMGFAAVAGDVGWCVAALVLILVTSALTATGEIALAVISIPVAGFAIAQAEGLLNTRPNRRSTPAPTV